jgi:hypothetical protein
MSGNGPTPPPHLQQMGMRPNFMNGPRGNSMMINQNPPNQQMMGRQRPAHAFQQGYMPQMTMNMQNVSNK